jgi:hypothetical protein
MNPKSLLAVALAGVALAGALLAPPRSIGQAAVDDPALTALLAEVAAQQAAVADNQTKIDTKLAAIGENIRLARIYAGRAGGKVP